MSKRDEMNDNFSKVKDRLGKTTGASKGSKPLPKPTISLKGTNPLKGKFSLTVKKKI